MTTLFKLMFLLCCLATELSAQSISFPINFDTIYVPKYNHKKPADNSVQLRMPYGSYHVINSSLAKELRGKTILEIKLIFTDYPKGDDFTTLNKQRLAALFLLAPELFDNPFIQWKLIYQTEATKNDAYHYYHGFEIVYRPEASEATAKFEMDYLINVIRGYTPISDSSLLKIMKRNDWTDMAIVGDFTGSMSPYIGQLLLWYNLTINKSKEEVDAFVFFNDGNRLTTAEKKIGKTGGIYYTEEKSIDSVLETAVTTIKNGFGGDGPENDVEALLYAQKKFKGSKHFVLVADNLSPMRDIELSKKLKKPVRIIICGASKVVNTQYIDLAYQTKGSIHTIEEDIEEMLHEIEEGEIIEISGSKFKLIDGRFTLVKIKRT